MRNLQNNQDDVTSNKAPMRNLQNHQDDVTSNSQALPELEADDDRIRALWATGQSTGIWQKR